MGSRFHQALLIVSTLLGSWLWMQAVHELGHVLMAVATGGTVTRVELPVLGFSRTDVSPNPQPLWVVWGGPVLGVLMSLALWAVLARYRVRIAYLARFFAGFCLVANGAYLLVGAFERGGDPGDLLRLGASAWLLVAFGLITVPGGFLLWLGKNGDLVRSTDMIGMALAVAIWIAVRLAVALMK